jgi:hypothetical protein
MAHKHSKKSHRRKTMKRKMRGGADDVNAPTVSGNLVLPQGIDYVKNAPMNVGMKGGMSKDATGVYGSPFFGVVPQERVQQGGMALYPVSVGERIDAGLAMKAGTAAIDNALSQVAGLRDPNQAGGRKRKTKKAKKSHRKAKKTQRKSKKSHRKSKKSHRKSKKSHRKAKKSHRKSKKSRKQRGGQMDYAESMKGGIIDAGLLEKAGLHDSWKSVAAGNVM